MEGVEFVPAALQIGHMHVERIEARARERRRHLDLRIDAFIAQYRHTRARA